MRLSLPATASRLMSAIHASFIACPPHSPLPFHALCGMESGVAPVFFRCGPVGSHPGRPAELTELTKAHRLDCARGEGELGVPIELGSVVEIDEVRERFAQVSARQKSNVLSECAHVDSNPDLVLNAVDTRAKHDVFAEHRVAPAQNRALRNVEREPRSDKLVNLRFDAEQSANRGSKAR